MQNKQKQYGFISSGDLLAALIFLGICVAITSVGIFEFVKLVVK